MLKVVVGLIITFQVCILATQLQAHKTFLSCIATVIQQTHSLVFFLVCSPAPNLVTKMFVMRLYTEFFLPYKLTLKGIVDITHL